MRYMTDSFANLIEFTLESKIVESFEREGQEQTDSAIEHKESVSKCALDIGFVATHRRRIGNTPVRG
jgi:hypothetical protein